MAHGKLGELINPEKMETLTWEHLPVVEKLYYH
jgi:hypothetical protein